MSAIVSLKVCVVKTAFGSIFYCVALDSYGQTWMSSISQGFGGENTFQFNFLMCLLDCCGQTYG